MSKPSLESVDAVTNFVPLGGDSSLQRLFSTFPSHVPGAGLLLMRLSLGITLIHLSTGSPAAISLAQIIGAAAGVFVIVGLWTPVTATLAALDQIWITFSFPYSQPSGDWIHILLAALCASVVMLGPGAWSIDARLFGRRRFPAHRNIKEDHPSKG